MMQEKVNEEEAEELPKFRLITGGKEPEDPNWLAALPLKTCFLTRPRHGRDTEILELYKVYQTDDDAYAKLVSTLNLTEWVWKDTLLFSSNYVLLKVLSYNE